MEITDYKNFASLDVRVGTIVSVENFAKARRPAYKLEIDFGKEIGILKSSAQITELYEADSLMATQVIAIINFPKKQIADYFSECLVLGVYGTNGVVVLRPDSKCENGAKIG